MPLQRNNVSSITGHSLDVYFTDDNTALGDPAWVDWRDWGTRPNPFRSEAEAVSGLTTVYTRSVGTKGRITLVIPSCPQRVYDALRAAKNATPGSPFLLTAYHPTLGPVTPVTRNVEYLDVTAEPAVGPEGGQWENGDPIEDVTIRLRSHGNP